MHTASTNYKDFLLLFAQFIELVKCLAEFLLRLSVKTGKTAAEKNDRKAVSKIMFNTLAPIIIKTRTPQVFGDFERFPASKCISWL